MFATWGETGNWFQAPFVLHNLVGEGRTTVAHGIFETNSSYRVKWGTAGGVVSVFQEFSASIGKAFILARALGAGLAFYGA